ncbi:chromate transporter [Thalassobacillus devorans]|nr:chromate transporter [Thalassobacillus devorans]
MTGKGAEAREETQDMTAKKETSGKRMIFQEQWKLSWAFFKVGMLGYGGGPSSIPLVHKEVVERYQWMTDDEFGDTLALANTLPGPIATKMAGYIGHRVGGVTGLINAVLATIVPTIILMIILLTSLQTFKDKPWVSGMTQAVIPIVGVMLAVLTWDFFKKAKKGLGWGGSIGLVAASVIALELLNIHPGILIFVLLLTAVLKKDKGDQAKVRERQGAS